MLGNLSFLSGPSKKDSKPIAIAEEDSEQTLLQLEKITAEKGQRGSNVRSVNNAKQTALSRVKPAPAPSCPPCSPAQVGREES